MSTPTSTPIPTTTLWRYWQAGRGAKAMLTREQEGLVGHPFPPETFRWPPLFLWATTPASLPGKAAVSG